MSCDCAALEQKLNQILAIVKDLKQRVEALENEELEVDVTEAIKQALRL